MEERGQGAGVQWSVVSDQDLGLFAPWLYHFLTDNWPLTTCPCVPLAPAPQKPFHRRRDLKKSPVEGSLNS